MNGSHLLYLGLSIHIHQRLRSWSVILYRLIAAQLMRGKLLSNCTAAGVNKQSISRTFQFVDLYQLVK